MHACQLFQQLFIVGVFIRTGRFLLLIFFLTFHSISHLLVGQLFERHGREEVPWLEYLLLVLRLESHAIVDIVIADINTIDGLVFAHRINVFLHNIRLRLSFWATCWLHHVRQLFYIIRLNRKSK